MYDGIIIYCIREYYIDNMSNYQLNSVIIYVFYQIISYACQKS